MAKTMPPFASAAWQSDSARSRTRAAVAAAGSPAANTDSSAYDIHCCGSAP